MFFFGAGLGADIAYSFLQATGEHGAFQGIIDTRKRGVWNGFPILSPNEVIDLDSNIVITARSPWGIDEINRSLREKGFHHIYSFNWCKGDRSFLENSCNNTSEWEGECVLPHLEMHIADSCNLKCKGCAHFSPIFNQSLPVYEECMNGIRIMKEKVSHIIRFYILGGEPLLNPELERYVTGIRGELPKTNIWLVTNGLLIPNLPDHTLMTMAENRIVVSISEYQPTHKRIGKIVERLEQFNVNYDLRPYDKKQRFNRPLSMSANSRLERERISNGCVNIWHGKISRCPTLMYIQEFNKKFGTKLPEEGILELKDCPSGQELLTLLKKEVPLCGHCVSNEMEWQTCTEVKLEDFAVWE